MEIQEDQLRELGFSEFMHLQKSKRDLFKRLVWMQVVENEIITIRVKLVGTQWLIDYVNPPKNITNISEAIKFIQINA
jgi:hypothetical protein